MLNVVMLNVFMLSVFMLSVIMLSVFKLSVVAPEMTGSDKHSSLLRYRISYGRELLLKAKAQ